MIIQNFEKKLTFLKTELKKCIYIWVQVRTGADLGGGGGADASPLRNSNPCQLKGSPFGFF